MRLHLFLDKGSECFFSDTSGFRSNRSSTLVALSKEPVEELAGFLEITAYSQVFRCCKIVTTTSSGRLVTLFIETSISVSISVLILTKFCSFLLTGAKLTFTIFC